jgi:hypothetical protein
MDYAREITVPANQYQLYAHRQQQTELLPTGRAAAAAAVWLCCWPVRADRRRRWRRPAYVWPRVSCHAPAWAAPWRPDADRGRRHPCRWDEQSVTLRDGDRTWLLRPDELA